MPRSSRRSTAEPRRISRMIEPPESAIGSVRLSRGMCYGTCPVYEVVLRREGTASWRGEAFTERLGEFEGQVDAADFLRLASFIERAGFFGWEDEYVAPVTDNPTHELEVVRDGDRRLWARASAVSTATRSVLVIPRKAAGLMCRAVSRSSRRCG
jgi:Domain of unknown function (DUF6438)